MKIRPQKHYCRKSGQVDQKRTKIKGLVKIVQYNWQLKYEVKKKQAQKLRYIMNGDYTEAYIDRDTKIIQQGTVGKTAVY